MRKLLSMAMVIGLVACHKTPQVEPRPLRQVGDYAFRMTIGAIPVNGEFSIEADTVTLDADDHSCRRSPTGIIDPLSHPFNCGGGPTSFSVVIDSKRPAESNWTSSVPVKKTTTVCTRYTTTKEGLTICSASRTEVVTVNERVSGRLEVKRIASVDKP
jgi:hypothetical protein